MGRRGWNNADDFMFGRRSFADSDDSDVAGSFGFNGNDNDVETIVSPTETVVNPTTNRRTVRRVHPTHIINVNRNITRVENFYPVTHSTKNINSVEEYNCGSDLNNPCCRPVNNDNNSCCRSSNNNNNSCCRSANNNNNSCCRSSNKCHR